MFTKKTKNVGNRGRGSVKRAARRQIGAHDTSPSRPITDHGIATSITTDNIAIDKRLKTVVVFRQLPSRTAVAVVLECLAAERNFIATPL